MIEPDKFVMTVLFLLAYMLILIPLMLISNKLADWHYSKVDTDAPLYLIYGYCFIMVWIGIGLVTFYYLEINNIIT